MLDEFQLYKNVSCVYFQIVVSLSSLMHRLRRTIILDVHSSTNVSLGV